jgi:hypothetical protein
LGPRLDRSDYYAEEATPDRVVIGGRMSDRKGVSLPDTDLPNNSRSICRASAAMFLTTI